MAKQHLRFLAALAATNFMFLCAAHQTVQAADGPNRVTSSDVAAGRWMDSLLDPDRDVAAKKRAARPRTSQRGSQRRPSLQGKLVRNSDAKDGTPPFALLDRYGGILRYVEPVESVELQKYLGRTIGVRHDTGDTLLASQLALPRTRRQGPKTGLNLAQHLEPIPAGEIISQGSPQGSATRGPAPHVHNHGPHAPVEEFVEEPIVIDGSDNGPIYLDGGYEESYDGGYESSYSGEYGGGYDDGLNFGGCPTCGDATCRQRSGGGGCGRGARGVMYLRGEYLLWHLEGMETPALVLSDDDGDFNEAANAETGNDPSIIFGGARTLEDSRNGGRIIFGLWLDDYGQWGVEGEYLRLDELSETFVAGQRNNLAPIGAGPFIGRPFFNTGIIDGNVASRGDSQEDVDTNNLDGSVTVNLRSDFQSAGIRLRHNLCCREGCRTGCGDGVGCGNGIGCGSAVGVGCQAGPLGRLCRLLRKGTRHTDVLYGFRWTALDESLQVNEDLLVVGTGLNSPEGTTFLVEDRFATENQFLGGEIGYETEWQLNRWSLNVLSKVAIGNTRQRVDITGSTVVDGETPLTGGLLAQRFVFADGTPVGNIGSNERDEFSMIPEVGLTMGYNLTQRLKLTAGYTLLYWSNVVRPGDQVDLDVNANLLPRNNEVPPAGTIVPNDHPRFVFHQTDLWAQGLNLGAEYTW